MGASVIAALCRPLTSIYCRGKNEWSYTSTPPTCLTGLDSEKLYIWLNGSQDVTSLPNTEVRKFTYTTHRYITLVYICSTLDIVHVSIRLWAWTLTMPGSYLGRDIRYPSISSNRPGEGQCGSWNRPRPLPCNVRSSSTGHPTRSKIYSVWTQFIYHTKSATCLANI
jgi:hypothetical protein